MDAISTPYEDLGKIYDRLNAFYKNYREIFPLETIVLDLAQQLSIFSYNLIDAFKKRDMTIIFQFVAAVELMFKIFLKYFDDNTMEEYKKLAMERIKVVSTNLNAAIKKKSELEQSAKEQNKFNRGAKPS